MITLQPNEPVFELQKKECPRNPNLSTEEQIHISSFFLDFFF